MDLSKNTYSPRVNIPGPVDRVSFFEEQKRNQRATWRLSAMSVIAVAAMGLPLSLIVTPLLYAVLLTLLHLINLIHPVPAFVWETLAGFLHTLESVLDHLDKEMAFRDLPWGDIFLTAVVLLSPGAIFLFFLWRRVRSLLRISGTEGFLLSLQARDLRSGDLEERQLSNIVEEMAIAGGVPPPQLKMTDLPAVNAAALGSSIDNATLVVSRGLLEKCNRDETQGVLAHLIASIGNGDLKIAMRVLSVFQTYGLLVTLLNAPFGSESRKAIWRLLRLSFRPKTKESASEIEEVSNLLAKSLRMEKEDELSRFLDSGSKTSKLKKILQVLLLPLVFANLAVRLTLFFSTTCLLEPCIALLWRSRRYLADAEAVQLTRNPEGLASALGHLTPVPSGPWGSHLFIGGKGGSESSGGGFLLSMNPPATRRLKRLKKMGAFHGRPEPPRYRAKWGYLEISIITVLVPLILLAIYLMVVVLILMNLLNLAFMVMLLAGIHFFFQLFH